MTRHLTAYKASKHVIKRHSYMLIFIHPMYRNVYDEGRCIFTVVRTVFTHAQV